MTEKNLKEIDENNPGKRWNSYYRNSDLNWENKQYYNKEYLSTFTKTDWFALIKSNLKPGQSVLDAGCGTGLFSIALAFCGYKVVAIDYNEEAVQLAKSNLTLYNSGADIPLEIDFRKGDLLNLDFADNLFDLVFNQAVLEYFIEDLILDKAISEMHRVTTSGGNAIAIVQNTRNPFRKLWKLMGTGTYGDQPQVRSIDSEVLLNRFSAYFDDVVLDGLYPWKAVFLAPKTFHKITYYLNRFFEKFVSLPRFIRSKIGIQLVVVGHKI